MRSHHVLSDSEWARIEPLLPTSAGRRGHPFRDHRQVVEGIIYRLRVGMPWRELPTEFGPWQTVWKRHRRFCTDGTLALILARLQAETERVAAAAQRGWRAAPKPSSDPSQPSPTGPQTQQRPKPTEPQLPESSAPARADPRQAPRRGHSNPSAAREAERVAVATQPGRKKLVRPAASVTVCSCRKSLA